MAYGDDPPLSLRPSPVADRKPQNIAEFIARANAQPGGFRAINEAKLREELAQEEAEYGDALDRDVDMADGDQDEDNDQDAQRDLQEVRIEMLKNLEYESPCCSRELDDIP
jgi:mediator of RNA polymerase II transcription subunit 17, fungi type